MTQEEKQLLLVDLCARLPYSIKVDFPLWHGYGINEVCDKKNNIKVKDLLILKDVMPYLDGSIIPPKPYLRPMSSMTKEEKHKLLKFGVVTCLENGEVVDVSCVGFERHADIQDYLNAHHFDYRGLIEKGLALEAPNGMYNTNNK